MNSIISFVFMSLIVTQSVIFQQAYGVPTEVPSLDSISPISVPAVSAPVTPAVPTDDKKNQLNETLDSIIPTQHVTGNLRSGIAIKPAEVSLETPPKDPLIQSLENAEQQLTASIGAAKAKVNETGDAVARPIKVDCGMTRVRVICSGDKNKTATSDESETGANKEEAEGSEEEES